MSLEQHKCPNCGGGVGFDPTQQMLTCAHCGSSFAVEASEQAPTAEVLNWEMPDTSWAPAEQQGMMVYTCRSCGGEIIAEATSGATSCPYCNNPVVATGQFSGALRPDLVLPFQQTKDQALETLKKHYQGKKLLPKSFQDSNHLKEIKGLYVPVWLFDADVAANATYSGVQEIRTQTPGGPGQGTITRIETRHFQLERAAVVGFDAIPVDGSSQMPDEIMESVAPFDVTQSVAFNSSYLAGFLADKYDVDAEAAKPRAMERLTATTNSLLRSTTGGYMSVSTQRCNIQVQRAAVHYGLLPVWILSTSWSNQAYTFAMNGQTGKFVGNLPYDKGRFWTWFLGLFFAIGIVLSGLSLLITGLPGSRSWDESGSVGWFIGAFVIGLIVALIVTGIWRGQLKTVRKQAGASEYVRRDSFRVTHSFDRYLRSTFRTQQSAPPSSSSGPSGARTSGSRPGPAPSGRQMGR